MRNCRGNSHRLRLTANPPPSGREAFGFFDGVGGGCCSRVLPQSASCVGCQLPPGGSLSYCTQCPAKEPIVPAAAESRNRAKPHRVAEGPWSRGPPPRGDWSEVYSMQSQDWSEGGSPEGADVPNAKSAAPSGPLCFFLGIEKEDATRKTIRKEKTTKQKIRPHANQQTCGHFLFNYIGSGRLTKPGTRWTYSPPRRQRPPCTSRCRAQSP